MTTEEPPSPWPSHPTVKVKVGNRSCEIDEALAPLIREMWLADIGTAQCCQECKPGMAWITFLEVDELMQFLNLVTRYESGVDTLYNRITNELAGPKSQAVWQIELELWDEGEQTDEAPVSLQSNLGIYFPATDIPVLIQRLREFNQDG